MEALSAIQERLISHNARIQANHDSIGDLRGKQSTQQIDIAVMHTELAGVREDISEMKADFSGQLTWVRRGLWAAAATFTMFVVALATLIVQVISGG